MRFETAVILLFVVITVTWASPFGGFPMPGGGGGNPMDKFKEAMTGGGDSMAEFKQMAEKVAEQMKGGEGQKFMEKMKEAASGQNCADDMKKVFEEFTGKGSDNFAQMKEKFEEMSANGMPHEEIKKAIEEIMASGSQG